ncbi:MAG: isochorismatase family protein, partial [Verrucomicrobia bacterium]|nr:isochorismatase family protein [Verrucomicrobiota bacterium]
TRSTMNRWDSPEFIAAVKRTGRRNLVVSAFWSEGCLAMPDLQALTDGYFVFAIQDASLGASAVAHQAALRRIEHAGGVPVTSLQLLFEFQRDWARSEHYDEVIHAVRARSSLLGRGAENTVASLKWRSCFLARTNAVTDFGNKSKGK